MNHSANQRYIHSDNVEFDFIPQGVQLTETRNSFYFKTRDKKKNSFTKSSSLFLDTGNMLTKGVIDHHQSGFEDLCTAYIVATESDEYLAHLRNNTQVQIITHKIPDLDAALSSYLAIKYIKGENLNKADRLLAEYALDVDSGRYSFDLEYPISVASLLTAITYNSFKEKNRNVDQNLFILNKSFSLFDQVLSLINQGQNPWNHNFCDDIADFDEYKDLIKNDRKTYRNDFEHSEIRQFQLLNRETNTLQKVDFICSTEPDSFLWKYWVRGDKKNSPEGNGFIFTAKLFENINKKSGAKTNRAIISVDPNLPFNFKGLGILLDSLEIKKLLSEGEENLEQNPREGFHRNNPWFDGRGSHNFTIIDAPEGGSLLSFQKIKQAIYASDYWQLIGLNFDSYCESYTQVKDLSAPEVLNAINFETLHSFLASSTNQAFESLPGVEKLLKSLFYAAPENQYEILEIKRAREKALNKIVDVYIDLPEGNKKDWVISVSSIIENYLPAEYCQRWLKEVKNLDDKLFWELFGKATSHMPSSELMPYLMQIRGNHRNIDPDQTVHNFIDDQELKSLCINYLKLDNRSSWAPEIIEEHPLYTYHYIKDHLDDLLYSLSEAKKLEKSTSINWFLKNSLEDYLNDQCLSFKEIKNYVDRSKEVIEEILLKEILGEQFSKLRSTRSVLLKEMREKNILFIKRVSVTDIAEMNFRELQQLAQSLSKYASASENLKQYIQLLNTLVKVRFFEFTESRMLYMIKVEQLVKGEQPASKFLNEHNEEVCQLLDILLSIWKSQYRFYFEAESTQLIDALTDQITKLKTLDTKSFPFDTTKELVEELYGFLTKVVEEQELSLSQVELIIELCFKQREHLRDSDHLLTQSKEFPSLINTLLLEIGSTFKKYYIEKVSFLQEGVQTVMEKDRISDQESSYFESFSENILNQTVSFEWDEHKKEVLKHDNANITSLFYQSYFFWLNEHRSESQNQDKNTQVISELESEIRFASAKTKISLEKFVRKLPKPKRAISLDQQLQTQLQSNLFYRFNHLPYSLYFKVYDYLSDKYISQYDVKSASSSLFKFSSKFPKYIAWFTATNNLRKSVVFLIVMVLLTGFFDPTYYNINGQEILSPASEFTESLVGETIHDVIHQGLKYFWIAFIGLGFLTPIVFVLYKFLWAPIKSFFTRSPDSKYSASFLDILSKIETKSAKLLYLSLIIPLLLVVTQLSSPSTFDLIDNFKGIRMASAAIIVLMLTLYSIYLDVKENNPDKPDKWILRRVNHMFWLHTLQAFILSIFVIDVLFRAKVGISSFSGDSVFAIGISRLIVLEIPGFDIVLMPIFTIVLTFMTMFVGFFINRIFNR